MVGFVVFIIIWPDNLPYVRTQVSRYVIGCWQKNSALAGAVTGAALALTTDDHSHEQVVQCAITGAAISTVANLLTGVF